jgi:hypothetical protein
MSLFVGIWQSPKQQDEVSEAIKVCSLHSSVDLQILPFFSEQEI